MSTQRHIILRLTDAHALAALPAVEKALPLLAARLRAETGADITEIAALLKAQTTCHACAIEGQAASCHRLETNKLGRRLSRLLDRAGYSEPPARSSASSALGWLPVSAGALAREEGAEEGDWTPPEDRGNFWDFDRAVEEQRKRLRREVERRAAEIAELE